MEIPTNADWEISHEDQSKISEADHFLRQHRHRIMPGRIPILTLSAHFNCLLTLYCDFHIHCATERRYKEKLGNSWSMP